MAPVANGVLFQITAQVQVPDGRPAYSVTMGQPVPPTLVSRLAQGLVVGCKVDPHNPGDVVLDFWGWAGLPTPR